MRYDGITGQRMPPYSTDPELSLSRHMDPEYVNSSDPPVPLSSDITMHVDIPIASSPPDTTKLDDLYSHQRRNAPRAFATPTYDRTLDDINVDEDEPTDADDDTDDDNDRMDVTSEPTITANILQPLFNDPSFNDPSFSEQPAANSSRSARMPIFAGAESTLKPQRQASFPRANRSSSYVMASRTESMKFRQANLAVARVFDDGENTINLENYGFESIPEACRSLVDLEDLDHRLFAMSLSGNNIRLVDHFLYRIDRLRYLNLRNNDITELSGLVRNLVELNELHLGHNKLQTLPVELLSLPKLMTLTTYPNDFLPAPDESEANQSKTRFIRNCEQPSLVELAQRSLVKAGSMQEFTDFKRLLEAAWLDEAPTLVSPILRATQIGTVCSICCGAVITPVATHLRWARHPCDLSGGTVPYQTVLCSDKCLKEFSNDL